jgi:AcrR family transcriptional regulator
VPVVYDHFESKLALHIHLLESHYADLREVWARTLVGDDPPDVRVARAFDAWFEYVETHPYASKMLFGDTTGDPEIQKWHRAVEVQSRQFAIPFLADEPGAELIAGADAQSMQMAWEVYRATLQGLAHWWRDNPDVPRERIVATAMNTLWLGFDRVRRGETWPLSP